MPPLLSIEGLGKTFTVREGLHTKTLRALADVSFDVERGECVAVVGESGSGKSTTARLIARLIEPSAGSIRLDATGDFRSRVQMIFQDPFASLNPVHTIGYHLERPLRRHGKARSSEGIAARVRDLLETVGLTPADEIARAHPHRLSGGQRQRVAIARALAVEPELILADEPTSMLDASIRIGILNLMRDLKEQRGIAFVLITHDLASARYLADRVVVLYAGHVVETGPTRDVIDDPKHPYTRLLISALPDPRGSFSRPLAARSGAPLSASSGCPFSGRCPDVHDRCRTTLPALVQIGRARTSRCHLATESS
jgi:peptide/nickel transport system ATP-binding protein